MNRRQTRLAKSVLVALFTTLAACGAPSSDDETDGASGEEALSNPSAVDDDPCVLDARYLEGAGIEPVTWGPAAFVFSREGVRPGDGLEGYDRLSATGKQEVLWQLHSSYSRLEGDGYRPTQTTNLRETLLAFPGSLSKSFTRTCDIFPSPKTKLVHTYGAVAKVRLEITNPDSGYTGIFQTGGPAIARISLAEPLDNVNAGFIPGLGLKFLVQGGPSENIIAMRNLSAQVDASGEPDHRIFREPWANEFEAPDTLKMKLVKHVFENALRLLAARGARHESPFYRSLFGLASTRGGDLAPGQQPHIPVSQVRTPRDLIFKPVLRNATATSGSTEVDFRDKLGALREGDVLFDVVVKGSFRPGQFYDGQNPATTEGEEVVIGKLVLESRFTASSFGDRLLFFKHRL